ncbi:hypothetical protein G6F35_017661 [Rhizopus arrhizus]|nr:hypothetical protein G6F31_019955 [Rhizopus arrhizus]KAG1167655.1 hypothetical protein G6F35_017661 [Rhizopus arrhizus]
MAADNTTHIRNRRKASGIAAHRDGSAASRAPGSTACCNAAHTASASCSGKAGRCSRKRACASKASRCEANTLSACDSTQPSCAAANQ